MTRITVIGGTGYAGSSIVRAAAARGHEVTSLSRSTPAEPVPSVRYVQGSVDTEAAKAIEGADVVVAALAPRGELAGRIHDTYSRLADLAARAGARFIVIGGFSSLRPAHGAPRIADGDDLPPQFAAEAREMSAFAETLLTAPEALDWLYVSPAAAYGAHAPGAERGTYRIGDDVALFDADGNSAISGPDFATAIVDEIERAEHHRTQIGVAY